jgi:PAS domain S-box-containing protein
MLAHRPMPAPAIPANEAQRLRALRDLCVLDTPAEERFDRIVRTAARLFQVPMALVSLLDQDRQWFKARYGVEVSEGPRSTSFCGHAILRPETMVVPDATQDPRFSDNPGVIGDPHVRFYAGQPLRAPEGSLVGTLCVVDYKIRDFSEEDRRTLMDLAAWAELELSALTLQEARSAIEQQKQFFALSEDMLGIISLESTLLRFSDSWTRTLGYSPEELRRIRVKELLHPEDQPKLAEASARAVGGEPIRKLDIRVRDRAGAWRWVQVNTVFSPAEQALYTVGREVTEQKQLESERRRVDQLKDEFVSTVSHELRTPLTSIRGALGLLQGGIAGPLPTEAKELVTIAQENSERLLRLINDILDLERMESGLLTFNLAPQELGMLIKQAIVTQRGYAAQYGVHLEASLEAPDAQAMVDADRFLQVLANLLSNAIKFSPEGEKVRVRLERLEGRLRVSVEDQGPGIPESFRQRIFQKFAQADGSDTRRKGGTGLGLSITRALVERLGGTLDFVTQEGEGTTFRVVLPEWKPSAP